MMHTSGLEPRVLMNGSSSTVTAARALPPGVVSRAATISIQSWPEYGYAALDVFMCGDAQPQKAVPVLRRAFKAGEVLVDEIRRGKGLVG